MRRRGVFKGKLTIASNFIQNIIGNAPAPPEVLGMETLLEVQTRLERLNSLLDKFQEIQSQIEDEVSADDLPNHQIEGENFESLYFRTISLYKHILHVNKFNERLNDQDENISVQSGSHLQSPPPIFTSRPQLPAIPIPKFNGNSKNWLEFRDTFVSLIHSNNSIGDLEKIYFLKGSLEGEAKEVIHSVDLTAANYKVIWDMLCDRYDNPNILVNDHLKLLVNLPNMSKDSYGDLRNILDGINRHLYSLKKLGVNTDSWDPIIIFLVFNKLDFFTQRIWEEKKPRNRIANLDEFKDFLKTRIEMLVTFDKNKPKSKIDNLCGQKQGYKQNQESVVKKSYMGQKCYCVFCESESHYITNCQNFIKLSVRDRFNKAKQLGLCLNCLRKGTHVSKNCESSGCRQCSLKHHSLLHYQNSNLSKNGANNSKCDKFDNPDKNNDQETRVHVKSAFTNVNNGFEVHSEVLLSTALVKVLDFNGHYQILRVLLDSGSQSNLITQEVCQKLSLATKNISISIVGINQTTSNINQKCSVEINSLHYSFKLLLDCLVVPEISTLVPHRDINFSSFDIPSYIKLADPSFMTPGKIDMLLGAEIFYKLLCIGQLNLGDNKPMLQKTSLGWVATGLVNFYKNSGTLVRCNLAINSEEQIQEQLEKFWTLEELSLESKVLSIEDIECEKIFMETTVQNSDGRFMVKIPLCDSPTKLGDSKQYALNRFLALERRLGKNLELKELYVSFMNEYEKMGHMSVARESEKEISYYLPHHGVLSEYSVTTKLRVVFNGSAKTTSGLSFNDIQYTGPNLQDELLAILLRFRKHNVVVCADIAKMYRMILINPSDKELQKILWRSDPSHEIKEYTLNTVTYGTKSAPYLAIRCLKELGLQHSTHLPLASKVILHDFYVDDLLSGAEDSQQAIKLCYDIDSILKSGCMSLRKWISNDSLLMNKFNNVDPTLETIHFGEKDNHKTLGLYWSFKEDMLKFSILFSDSNKITKRIILSDVAKIFDPLGLLGPCIVIAKILLQKLWSQKLKWDESLPMELHSQWMKLKSQFSNLNNLSIKRHVLCNNPIKIELHGFSDASKDAYGACIYMRTVSASNTIQVSLLCSKVKVAPLKTQTIPRLELCGALLLAKLVKKVTNFMELKINEVHLWCDSTVTLTWIRMCPSTLQVFISNRVSQIQSLTNINDWKYIKSENNAADLLSRGIFPEQILDCSMWWNGPEFLAKRHIDYSKEKIKLFDDELPEQKKYSQICKILKVENKILFETFGNFSRLVRTIAYCLRFLKLLTIGKANMKTRLTREELDWSLVKIIKIVQEEAFGEEIKILAKGSKTKNIHLLKLHPFIDSNGLLRVGGRIQLSSFNYDKKHQILLPKNHHFTKLVFVAEHKRLLHPGPQMLLSQVRDKYWVIGGRDLARKTSFECVKCFKSNPITQNQIMGSLPKERVDLIYPFYNVGVDYAGPLYIKDRNGRGAKVTKCYICLFICLSTKAIHLELVSNLTTEAFIATFRRFVARRGKPKCVFSDNGSNFRGANNELRQLGEFLKAELNSISEQIENEQITWKFIPTYSPNFGGIWEAGVKSCKMHLKRILGNHTLTFEGLYTVLSQIESVLNSRPLTPLSSSPDDFDILTPSHFLIGRKICNLPDPNLREIPKSKLSMYQHLQMIFQHFWQRWSTEYLNELQTRAKWYIERNNVKIGDVVLIKDKNLPPLQWRLGRVNRIIYGIDNKVRVVILKTNNGEVTRGVTQVCPLPVDTL